MEAGINQFMWNTKLKSIEPLICNTMIRAGFRLTTMTYKS